MTPFKTKKIRRGAPPSKKQEKKQKRAEQPPSWFSRVILGFLKRHYIWAAVLIVMSVGFAKAGYHISTTQEDISIKTLVTGMFGQKVQVDEENHTNILVIGTGNEIHDGANLTDTLIVVSLDHDLNWVSMLSIPRDLYVTIDELYGGNRINSIFELYAEQEIYTNNIDEEVAYQMSYEVLRDTVSEIVDLPIHYYARVDFKGFEDLVDALGGINVYVEEELYDPLYPSEDGTYGHQIFHVEEGIQAFDGATALKYVRSRQTTSDFDRGHRQQIIIKAIKDKALSLGVLANPTRLKEIYSAIDNNFDTDMEWDEMIYMAGIADRFSSENMSNWVLNDNPLTPGGFLYTPEREYYGGSFVLVPYVNDYSDIHRFADLVLMHPEVHAAGLTYQILNGSRAGGIASSTMYYLGRFGFDIVRFGNAANREAPITRIIPRTALLEGQGEGALEDPHVNYLAEFMIQAGFVMDELPQEYSPVEWQTEADIILELGQDWINWMEANPQHFY